MWSQHSTEREPAHPAHQTQAERVKVGKGKVKPAQCYIDGVAGPMPTLYIEKSGA